MDTFSTATWHKHLLTEGRSAHDAFQPFCIEDDAMMSFEKCSVLQEKQTVTLKAATKTTDTVTFEIAWTGSGEDVPRLMDMPDLSRVEGLEHEEGLLHLPNSSLFVGGCTVYESLRQVISTWPSRESSSTAQDEPREIDDDLQMDYRDFQKQAPAAAT